MLEREQIQEEPTQVETGERQIARGIWIRRLERGQASIEILLPEPELNAIVEDCLQEFSNFAAGMGQGVNERENGAVDQPALEPELAQGLFNLMVLGQVLDRTADPQLNFAVPLVFEAFRLAAEGNLKLTPEPQPAAPPATSL